VLRGGEQDAFFLQAGGVAHTRHVTAYGFNFESIQVDATENDPGSSGRRQNSEMDRGSAV
jgi:hypothetical protein